jgi:hypothetical protein
VEHEYVQLFLCLSGGLSLETPCNSLGGFYVMQRTVSHTQNSLAVWSLAGTEFIFLPEVLCKHAQIVLVCSSQVGVSSEFLSCIIPSRYRIYFPIWIVVQICANHYCTFIQGLSLETPCSSLGGLYVMKSTVLHTQNSLAAWSLADLKCRANMYKLYSGVCLRLEFGDTICM